MATKVLNGLDLSNQRIVSLGDPSTATDAVTKQYVDNLLNGLAWKAAVRAATTANITLSGTQTVDGVSLVATDRVLVKDQTTASANGIYVVAAGAWSRATDADSAAELVNATTYVSEGTVNADKAFTQTANAPIVVGTTNLAFAQQGGGTAYTAGNGLSLSSTTFSVLANGTSIDVSGTGVKIADAAGGNGLTVSAGVLAVGAGTGISVAADAVAVDTAVVVRKYAANVGNGSSTSIAVTHNLGTRDITWALYDSSTFEDVMADGVRTDANTLTLTFASAPSSNAYRVVVHA